MTIPSYALPNTETITRRVLDNGIVVLVYENPAVESVTLQGSLRAGSIYEPLEQNGLASMTAAGLMRGTQARDFETLHSTLEDSGAELDFGAGKHAIDFNGKALAEDLALIVEVLADVLRNPTFPEAEIEEERAKRITELHFAEQDTRYMAGRSFRQSLYPNHHPYHYSTYGSVDSLNQLTPEAIHMFHQQQYGPADMRIVVVGAVNADSAVSIIADKLGDWHNAQQSAAPNLPALESPETIVREGIPLAGKTQSDIVMGSLGPSRHADDFIAASLANSILGEFGMMGRIGDVIREQLGLAYYAYSRLEAGQGPGAWHITAGVAPENVELTIEKAQDEVRRLTTELVSAEDLDDNQSYFTGRLPLQLESNAGLASAIHTMERYQLGLDYLMRYRETIYSISREDVLAAAQHYLHPGKLVISVAGPRQ